VLTGPDLPPQDVGVGWPSAVLSISGGHLYSANAGYADVDCHDDSELKGYGVDAAGGALRELSGSPFARGDSLLGPWDAGYRWLGVRPAGDILYLATGTETIRFKLDPATGAATRTGASPFSLGYGATFSPAGRLYAGAADGAGIQAFDVRADTGEMIPIPTAPYATEGLVLEIAIDASSRFLYAAQMTQSGAMSVLAFSIDTATGALRQAPGPPTPAGGPEHYFTIAIANVR
jgi:hypothetical protein